MRVTFSSHVHTNSKDRFVVRLPFGENPAVLGESKSVACNRFIGLERRLLRIEDIIVRYTIFLREYEQLGHTEKIDISTISYPKYFIPHHCVLKPDSTTTKLRVVFDASTKALSGPTVQSELFSILLRSRFPKFVFITDIEKIYRQILINPWWFRQSPHCT